MRTAAQSYRTRASILALSIVATIAIHPILAQTPADTGVAKMQAPHDSTIIPLTVPPPRPKLLRPTGPELTVASIGVGALEGLGGALFGNTIDYARCSSRHRGETGDLFDDPCFFYSSDGKKIGWFAGSFAGATGMAIAMARIRGCPLRPAAWRATAGSVVGMLPAIITAATPSKKIPSGRSWRIASAPVLGGLGAAIAVAGCHR